MAKIDSSGVLEQQYFTGAGPDSALGVGNGFPYHKIYKSKLGGYYIYGNFLKWDGKPTQPIVRLHGLSTSTGLEKKQPFDNVQIYPNPAGDYFFIQSTQEVESIELYSLQGKLIRTYSIDQQEGPYQSPATPGVYLIRIGAQNGYSLSRKLVKAE